MKLSLVFPLVLLFAVPAVHAQTNPIFGALQSVQSAITQTKKLLPQTPESNAAGDAQQSMTENEKQAQEDSARISAADQAQYQAQTQRRQAASKQASDQADAEALAVENASIRRDAERQQQAVAQAKAMPPLCPGLDANKLGVGGFFVACKNKGATEPQMLARLGALPMMQQALYTDIIQDIYDNNITDIKKGNAIAEYDIRCTAQNNCKRIAW